MREGSDKAGLFVSGAMHAALLGLILVAFAAAPPFEDATESVPVDTITRSEFNQIMHGEKAAKPAPTPVATPRAAPAAAPMPPQPPPDLRKAEETPPPPPKPAPEPPARPAPPKPEAFETPQPPVKPKVVETPPERPREPPPDKFRPDALAKLLAKEKSDEPPKPAAAPKTYDPRAIARLIAQSKPAEASPSAAANAGSPNQHAARMSPSLAAALDSWFKDAYMNCWSPPPTMPEGDTYIPEVQVEFNADGSLSGQPVLINPPDDPAWRAHAESAMRAALRCNPMRVPPQYAPYFEQWRTKTIHFDPREALG